MFLLLLYIELFLIFIFHLLAANTYTIDFWILTSYPMTLLSSLVLARSGFIFLRTGLCKQSCQLQAERTALLPIQSACPSFLVPARFSFLKATAACFTSEEPPATAFQLASCHTIFDLHRAKNTMPWGTVALAERPWPYQATHRRQEAWFRASNLKEQEFIVDFL